MIVLPFFIIPIIFGVLTGGAIATRYCDDQDMRNRQQTIHDMHQYQPSGDRMCQVVTAPRQIAR
jgi:hypothetical protein